MGSDGLWNGTTGLHSTTAAAANQIPDGPEMGILAADAADLGLAAGDMYCGITIPAQGAILARYTYTADTDLNGQLDHGEEGDTSLPALPVPVIACPVLVSASTIEIEHGTVTLEADGSFVYLPSDNYTGPETFSYTVTNQGTGATATATVTVTVENVAPAVGITGLPGGKAPKDAPITLGSSVIDPGQNETFTYAWDVTKVAGGTTTEHFATGTAADFTFTPNEEGAYTVQLVVTDAAGDTGTTQAVIYDDAPRLYWLGNDKTLGGDGTWDFDQNHLYWRNESGKRTYWTDGSIAVFEGTGNSTVTVVPNPIRAAGIEFNTFDSHYTIASRRNWHPCAFRDDQHHRSR